jgi:hypothetical protein
VVKRSFWLCCLLVGGIASAVPPPFPGGFLLVHPDPANGLCPEFKGSRGKPTTQYWYNGRELWRISVHGEAVATSKVSIPSPFVSYSSIVDAARAYSKEPNMCYFYIEFDPSVAGDANRALSQTHKPGTVGRYADIWYWRYN